MSRCSLLMSSIPLSWFKAETVDASKIFEHIQERKLDAAFSQSEFVPGLSTQVLACNRNVAALAFAVPKIDDLVSLGPRPTT